MISHAMGCVGDDDWAQAGGGSGGDWGEDEKGAWKADASSRPIVGL